MLMEYAKINTNKSTIINILCVLLQIAFCNNNNHFPFILAMDFKYTSLRFSPRENK